MEKLIWPEWWNWEIELSPHVYKRMIDRQFNEVDLRLMLENAIGYQKNIVEGRWVIKTRRHKRVWEVIIEPDSDLMVQIVITAYPIWEDQNE